MIEHDPGYRMINQIPFEFHSEDAEKELEGGTCIQQFLEYFIMILEIVNGFE